MIKAVVKFAGPQTDAYGMPIPFHSYFVVSSPWQAVDSGIASIVPLSLNAPFSRQHYVAFQGGERAAFDLALQGLTQETGNSGLTRRVDEG